MLGEVPVAFVAARPGAAVLGAGCDRQVRGAAHRLQATTGDPARRRAPSLDSRQGHQVRAPRAPPRARSSREAGPLAGVRCSSSAGMGPGPFSVMLLADMGASVVRVDRASARRATTRPTRSSSAGDAPIAVDLKSADGVGIVLGLVPRLRLLGQGFRPGVAERLGLGRTVPRPQPPAGLRPMTGWGQPGPWPRGAGHDINYIGITGALARLGRAASPPVCRWAWWATWAAAACSLAFGVVAALLEAHRTSVSAGRRRDVLESTATLMGLDPRAARPGEVAGRAGHEPPRHRLSSTTTSTRARTVGLGGVGAIEERFFRNALGVLGLSTTPGWLGATRTGPDGRGCGWRSHRLRHPDARRVGRAVEDVEACVSPVLDLDEARSHCAEARSAYADLPGTASRSPLSRRASAAAGLRARSRPGSWGAHPGGPRRAGLRQAADRRAVGAGAVGWRTTRSTDWMSARRARCRGRGRRGTPRPGRCSCAATGRGPGSGRSARRRRAPRSGRRTRLACR